ncbi:MAG: methionine adenosyltransferase [Deltaproteobacteria bacterium]|nr:methionine adenosyltransferase [Deltaproteobacteria bacterium]
MDKFIINAVHCPSVMDEPVEIVERKGTGHPDYICDAVMESISIALCREYLKRFGAILHHNIDKGLLAAGSVERRFGGGRVIRPMELIIGDRAAYSFGKKKIPVDEIARAAARAWIRENLPHVDAEKDVNIRVVLQPGSAELSSIFARKGRVKAANDTSAAVGYAPMTRTEKAVFETERFINSLAFKQQHPEAGSDVKVMGVRRGKDLDLTIACPLMSRLVQSEKDYFRKKEALRSSIRGFAKGLWFNRVTLHLNALDKKGMGIDGVYMTLLGTSAEDADSGQVGRGNRVNGVISLNRPMSTEAAAGKNPVSHVGKIYTILAHRIAGEIYERADGIQEVYVWLLSRIGSPIDRPEQVYVRVIPMKKASVAAFKRPVRAIVEEYLSGIGAFTDELARGEHPVC